MNERYSGKFIVIEGLDGAGTTTQVKLLANYLFDKSKKNDILLVREPTTFTNKGREIRRRLERNLLEDEEETNDFSYWADLFVGDRIEHLEKRVIPSLQNNLHVVSDRHMLSTLAYQSFQGGHIDNLLSMHEGLYKPDLTIFVRVPADVALLRIKSQREGGLEYFEENLPRIAENYETAILQMKKLGYILDENLVVVDGTKKIEKVFEQIKIEVDRVFGYN